MKIKILFIIQLVFVTAYYSCNKSSVKQESSNKVKDSRIEGANCDTKTIKDPNNPKPMAIMMRQMVIYMDTMNSYLQRKKKLDSTQFPFLRFYLVEPTDPSVLEPKFFENAKLFQDAYNDLFKHPEDQKNYYNLVIGKCVNCHESYCNGPLKRIKKFYLLDI